MRDKTELNCPNCGAPITGERCEYCGSVFYDWACLDSDKPFFIKIKRGNDLVMAKTVLEGIKITEDDDPLTLYADNKPYKTIHKADITIDASFRVVPFSTNGNNDVLFVRMDTDICDVPMEDFKPVTNEEEAAEYEIPDYKDIPKYEFKEVK